MLDTWQPASKAERYHIIDVIRGLALFGVLIVNLLSAFRVPLLEHIRDPFAEAAPIDRLVEHVVAAVLEFKALTVFSFLFGAGIAIQAERASARGVNAGAFLLRRFLWLLVFGAIHLLLIWNGDILTLYAICGLLLLPLLNARPLVLLVAGAAMIVLPDYVPWGLPWPSGAAANADIAQAHRIYANGSYFAVLSFHWHETRTLIVPLLVGVLPRTVGLMYLGAAAWRAGILRDPARHRRALIAALVIGLLAAVTGPIPLATAYVSALLLWRPSLPGLAALGQMALTNYLMQSIVLGFVFYGYGLGLFGRIGSAVAAGIGVALYLAQIQFSRWWLSRFRFGPFEWLWRTLSYGRRQPMTRL